MQIEATSGSEDCEVNNNPMPAPEFFNRYRINVNPGQCVCSFFSDYPDPPCAAVCPKDAISLNPLKIDPDRCDNCMACAAACPTDAFMAGESFFTDIAEAVASTAGGEILLRCSRIFADAPEVPCLCSLGADFLAGLALKYGKEVRLLSGGCEQCEIRSSRGLTAKNLRNANGVLEACGSRAGIRLESRVSSKDEGGRLSRRRVFARFGGFLAMRVFVEPPASTDGAGINVKRRRIADFIGRLPEDVRPRIAEFFDFFGKTIDKGLCDGCAGNPLCVCCCPSKALSYARGSDGLNHGIDFNPAACTGCGVCANICGKKAVASTPASSAFYDPMPPVRLIDFQAARCSLCEKFNIALHDGMCSECRQRAGKLNWECA